MRRALVYQVEQISYIAHLPLAGLIITPSVDDEQSIIDHTPRPSSSFLEAGPLHKRFDVSDRTLDESLHSSTDMFPDQHN